MAAEQQAPGTGTTMATGIHDKKLSFFPVKAWGGGQQAEKGPYTKQPEHHIKEESYR